MPGLIIKENYWAGRSASSKANAIDFFVHILGLSFHDAMRQICGDASVR